MQRAMTTHITLDAAFYNFTQDVLGALGQAMSALQARSSGPIPQPPALLQVRRGYAESPGWFLVQAVEFDPDPLTVEGLRVRDIYASEGIVQALLEMMAGEKWLDRRFGGEYFLDQAGRDIVQKSRDRQSRYISQLEPLPVKNLAELEQLLARVIRACTQASSTNRWCLMHSLKRSPGEQALPLEHVRQYLEDINAFRDDAHMAAWKLHNIRGHIWETFACACNGEAATGDALFDLLSHRGYSRTDYALALEDLVARGWVAESTEASRHAVTPVGQEVRIAAEGLTDKYFYDPWKSNLSEIEVARLGGVLERLKSALEENIVSLKWQG